MKNDFHNALIDDPRKEYIMWDDLNIDYLELFPNQKVFNGDWENVHKRVKNIVEKLKTDPRNLSPNIQKLTIDMLGMLNRSYYSNDKAKLYYMNILIDENAKDIYEMSKAIVTIGKKERFKFQDLTRYVDYVVHKHDEVIEKTSTDLKIPQLNYKKNINIAECDTIKYEIKKWRLENEINKLNEAIIHLKKHGFIN